MSKTNVYLPTGKTLTMVTNALAGGYYQQVHTPGTEPNTPTSLNANTTTTIGPFDGVRSYRLQGNSNTTVAYTVNDAATAIPTPVSIGGTSVTATGTELNYVAGVTSAIQTQLSAKSSKQIAPTVYSVNGAMDKTVVNAVFAKSGVLAMTLSAPVATTDDGLFLRVTSYTASAHTLTSTGAVYDGTTGGPHDLITFAAFPGASVSLIAYNGYWMVQSKNNVTVS